MGHIWKCIKSNNIQFESFYVSCCIVCKSQKFLYRQCSQRQRYTARGWLEECEELPSGWLSDQNCWWHDACKYKYEDCSEVSTAAAQHLPPNKWAPIWNLVRATTRICHSAADWWHAGVMPANANTSEMLSGGDCDTHAWNTSTAQIILSQSIWL